MMEKRCLDFMTVAVFSNLYDAESGSAAEARRRPRSGLTDWKDAEAHLRAEPGTKPTCGPAALPSAVRSGAVRGRPSRHCPPPAPARAGPPAAPPAGGFCPVAEGKVVPGGPSPPRIARSGRRDAGLRAAAPAWMRGDAAGTELRAAGGAAAAGRRRVAVRR